MGLWGEEGPPSSAGTGAEMERSRDRNQEEERQQYISKIPSSSFLRMLPERVDKLNAADALVAVPVVSPREAT